MNKSSTKTLTSVRIDKWLWAARFFKTRSQAKQALEGGKIHINGQRVKASKDIHVGILMTVRQGWDEKEIRVEALSEQRRGADEASMLYNETEASIAARKLKAEQRKANGTIITHGQGRPNAKQRKQIHEFKRIILNDD